MSSPLSVELDIQPGRTAVQSDAATSLDVLVSTIPPPPLGTLQRPPLNLALVLDRSGSMAGGGKLEAARAAAIFAVEQLLPTDRVSVTVFDDAVATIVRSTLAQDRPAIVAALRAIQPGNTTALHSAWKAGADQVCPHVRPRALNRVLLLSDGLANVGLTDPEAITADVRHYQKQQVTTSTLGVGQDYNEDLLEAMAAAGDGNYYYVESASQLADLFQSELHSLMATIGRDVTVQFEPLHGVEFTDLYNDLERLPDGRYRAPNLVYGMPSEFLVRLTVPPQAGVRELLRVRFCWDQPGVAGRQTVARSLILPAVPAAEWSLLPENSVVRERNTLLKLARMKLQARARMLKGDRKGLESFLDRCAEMIDAMPSSPETQTELDSLLRLQALAADADTSRFAKQTSYESYTRRRTRSSRPGGGTPPPPDPSR